MTSKFRRLACVCLTAVMTVSLAAGNALAIANSNRKNLIADVSDRYDTVNVQNVTGKVDLTGVALQNVSDDFLENPYYQTVAGGKRTVIVSLNEASLLDGKDENQSAASYLSSYSGSMALKKIKDNQDYFLQQLRRTGVGYKVLSSYNTLLNAVALEVDSSDIAAIKKLPQVTSVVFSETYAFPKDETGTAAGGAQTNPSNVENTGIYKSSPYLEDYSDGTGIRVAVLDTGLDYTHSAFSTVPDEYDWDKAYITQKLGSLDFDAEQRTLNARGTALTADDVYINAKVPYAYDYADDDADVYPSYSQHGTHVAGIITGQADSYVDKDGEQVNEPFRGVAPNVQLVICKIFTDDFDDPDLGGATSEDIISALEDCVNLGVDVINMSIGTTSGFGSISIDGDTEGALLNGIYGRLQQEGINVLAAAGNEFSSGFGSAFGTNRASNPDSGTVGSPSTFTGSFSVASINGQLSRFMSAKTTENGQEKDTAIFYLDSNNANQQANDFCAEMLSEEILNKRNPDYDPNDPDSEEYVYRFYEPGISSFRFKYVVIPGIGQASDYTSSIRRELADKSNGPVIALVQRGSSTFEDKVDIAQRQGADAIIVYNNVAGTIRMSLGELKDPIPAVSIPMDAGRALMRNGRTGYIEVNSAYQAGPFMNDYSGWGATPDLRLKPEITSHGGEITSTVAGGYAEMSGTSMATPNLAGFAALLRGYLKNQNPNMTPQELTRLSNQITMSTATIVYDQDGLAYSPRKQGAGLATLDNVFKTNAYLYTQTAEDNRPKIELGDDKNKNGVYGLDFYVNNTGSAPLTFSTKSLFMTERISSDGMSVAEQAHMLNGSPVWTVGGTPVDEGGSFTVPAGEQRQIHVTLTLSDEEKRYIDSNFVNGMYVEGFLRLVSETAGQCDLSLPFMGFYGDWNAAPLLDYNAFEIAEFEQDASYTDETRPQPQVWATQAFGAYYNDRYFVPMGSYLYNQDENAADHIYTNEDHAAISRYNNFYGDESTRNYMTVTSIRALYAGLLRNTELITYELFNADTGESIEVYDPLTGETKQRIYRTGKSLANSGSAIPSLVSLELNPEELGLAANGKYRLEFKFYRLAEDVDDPAKQDNTFSMSFYVDYEAPVLADSRIRYYDYKDANNRDRQSVYLDLDIYDNHYAQSVLLCYAEGDGTTAEGAVSLNLATEYITPVYNAVKNGITTVSLDITDIYERYNGRLYVQIDDYALNHNVYQIGFASSKASGLPAEFDFSDDGRIVTNSDGSKKLTIGVNEAYKLQLDFEGSANASNFTWLSSSRGVVAIKDNEIFGLRTGTSVISATGADGVRRELTVEVVASDIQLSMPALTFDVIQNSQLGLQPAQGTVRVNAGTDYTLLIKSDPWYYPVEDLELEWTSSDPTVATVDRNGNVHTLDKEGITTIRAAIVRDGVATIRGASVMLSVQDPFRMSGTTLTDYHGNGGAIVIPTDKNIMTIGEEAFMDNDNITSIVIPKSVTQIQARAFKNCTALEHVYFDSTEETRIADCDLSLILRNAFEGCVNLKTVDFRNVKTITLDREAFLGCTSLEQVLEMENVGTMGDRAFAECSSLLSAKITGLHTAGAYVFAGCTSLREVETAFYTQIGEGMFTGYRAIDEEGHITEIPACTSLIDITINCGNVPEGAFGGCVNLETVSFGNGLEIRLGNFAFSGCSSLEQVDFNGNRVVSIGGYAFENCVSLTELEIANGDVELGESMFSGSDARLVLADGFENVNGALYKGTTLVYVPASVRGEFAVRSGTTEIGAYAFSNLDWQADISVTLPESVRIIGEGAFAHCAVTGVTLPSGLRVISDYAFYDTKLTGIAIPASVETIGAGAFQGSVDLAAVTFGADSALKEIGSEAFLDCQSLAEIVLPDGAASMGDRVFGGCIALTSVTLPSVTTLGINTFIGDIALETAVFGANATTAGVYTFFPGYRAAGNGSPAVDSNGNPVLNESALTSVTLGNATAYLGEGVFAGCTELVSIDLKQVTAVGAQAFVGCTSLQTVTGLDRLELIGDAAFADCANIAVLNLTSAIYIGDSAFYMSSGERSFTRITVPNAQYIGANAFAGGSEQTVTLPASVSYVGAGAFANSPRLTSITVAAGSDYFSEDGVLYRSFTDNLNGGRTVYELTAYPSGRTAESYEIKEGTVSVLDYAFSFLAHPDGVGAVGSVLIPYSVKTIGHAAFFSSGITDYVFHPITAPTLLIEYYNIQMQDQNENPVSYYSLFYQNFETDFLQFSPVNQNTVISNLRISYPSNGVGYDNFIYSRYFGEKVVLEEMPEDDTRTLKDILDNLLPVDVINGWNSLEVNAENKATVVEFSDLVKEAHRLYNNIRSEVQLNFVGADNVNKLFAVEAALKPVKNRFEIATRVTGVAVSPDSAHKREYKVGESFDMTGLVLIVTYDDYSTEIADLNQISIMDGYGANLTVYDNVVYLSGYGRTMIPVGITVTEGGPEDEGGGEFNPAVIYGPIIGVVVIAAAVVTVVLVLKKKGKKTEEKDNSNE